jgi:hypothetical protein
VFFATTLRRSQVAQMKQHNILRIHLAATRSRPEPVELFSSDICSSAAPQRLEASVVKFLVVSCTQSRVAAAFGTLHVYMQTASSFDGVITS